jgi:hypothetical protein
MHARMIKEITIPVHFNVLPRKRTSNIRGVPQREKIGLDHGPLRKFRLKLGWTRDSKSEVLRYLFI